MTAWETVHTDLLTFLATLAGLTLGNVLDGPVVAGDDWTAWALVGDDGTGRAGVFEQDVDNEALTSETGTVNVQLVARTGDTDAASLSALRQAVESWVNSLRAHYKDQTLGKTLSQGSTVRIGSVDIEQAQTKHGARVEFSVAVRYFTRF